MLVPLNERTEWGRSLFFDSVLFANALQLLTTMDGASEGSNSSAHAEVELIHIE